MGNIQDKILPEGFSAAEEKLENFLEKHEACSLAKDWIAEQPVKTVPTLWESCSNGEWMLWFHEKAGTPFEVLAPVVYRAVNRALRYAEKALDAAGVAHSLAGVTVHDKASCEVASRAASEASYAAEQKQIADDCRELLPAPEIGGF